MDKLITYALIEKAMDIIGVNGPYTRDSISYEIQDDYQFVLFSVLLDSALTPSESEACGQVARLLNDIMPTRQGEYTWMVNFVFQSEIVASYFGGDELSPDSGL